MQTGISRVQRSKAEAKAAYDKMSRWYDVLASSSEQPSVRLGLEKLAAAEGEVILEIGFGTGHALVALAEAVGDSGMVYGIDISEGMRSMAQEKLKRAGLAERVVLKLGDADSSRPGRMPSCVAQRRALGCGRHVQER
jgi:ubiquinone/menaquinone biosynthesis C-methylase UbiE